MKFEKVLVLGAHPDDESGCSGTVQKLLDAGAEIHLLTFSKCLDFYDEDLIVGEWERASDFLGIPSDRRHIVGVPNRLLPAYRQDVLNELDFYRDQFDLVLCPAFSDIHQDHHVVAEEAARVFKHTTVLGYEHAMNSVRSTQWQCFVSLDERQVEMKLAHAKMYESQQDRPYMAESYLRGLLAVHGVQAGVEAAEAFEVVRWVW